MAISRWERGELEPTDRAYIELGNLARNPKCWYFWERAGLHSENLLRVMPKMRDRLQTSTFANLRRCARPFPEQCLREGLRCISGLV